MLLNQGEMEIQSVKAKEKTKRQLEREKVKRELDRQRQMEAQLLQQKERFMVLRDLIDAGASAKISTASSESEPRTPAKLRFSDPKVTATPSYRVNKLFSLKHLVILINKSILRASLSGWWYLRPQSVWNTFS